MTARLLAVLVFHSLRRVLVLLTFLATFMVDVRVKADVAVLTDAVTLEQEPKTCWKTSEICAIRTQIGERARLRLGLAEVVLSEATLVLRLSDTRVKLLAGTLWVKSKETALTIESDFGKIQSVNGELWITKTPERVTASAVVNSLWLEPRGSEERLEVLPGLENWLGPVVTKLGRADSGVPTAIPWEFHLLRWASLYPGGPGQHAAFLKEVEQFYPVWQQATQTAVEIHKALFDRKMASIDQADAKREAEKAQSQIRTEELVRMFRAKVLDP